MAIKVRYEKNGQLVVLDKNFGSVQAAERMADFIRRFKPDASKVKVIAPKRYLALKDRHLLGIRRSKANDSLLRTLRHKKIVEFIRHGPKLRYYRRELYDLIKPNVTFETFKTDIASLVNRKTLPAFVFKDLYTDTIDRRREFILEKMEPGRVYTSGALFRSMEFGFDYKTFYKDVTELIHQGRIRASEKFKGGHTTLLKKVL